MEREASNTGILKRYWYLIPALMAIASLGSAVLRFSGDWSHFWAMLAVQAWFMQAAFAYLRGGLIAIGLGGLSRDAAPLGRLALAAPHLLLTCWRSSMGLITLTRFMNEELRIGQCLPGRISDVQVSERQPVSQTSGLAAFAEVTNVAAAFDPKRTVSPGCLRPIAACRNRLKSTQKGHHGTWWAPSGVGAGAA